MARHGKMLIALVVSILALTLAAAETPRHNEVDALGRGLGDPQCGPEADYQRCPEDLCCSIYGCCGDSYAYCGPDCASQCPRKRGLRAGQVGALGRGLGDPQCGPEADYQRCPEDLCCSIYGYCGDSYAYCGPDCASQCPRKHGLRAGQVGALGRGLGDPQCGPEADYQRCPEDLCCSIYGYCGDSYAYCGPDCASQCPRKRGLRATTGKASYYSKYVPSACYGSDLSHFPPNRYMAAVSDGNPNLWKNGQGCGKHYQIRCVGNGCRNGDAITIQVVDRCPNGCQGHVFDLSEEAFGAIADKNAGVIKVDYAPIERVDAIPGAQKKLIVEVGHIRK